MAQEVKGEDHRVQGGCERNERGGDKDRGRNTRIRERRLDIWVEEEEEEKELTNVTGVVGGSEYEFRSSVVARTDVGDVGLSLHQDLCTVCV